LWAAGRIAVVVSAVLLGLATGAHAEKGGKGNRNCDDFYSKLNQQAVAHDWGKSKKPSMSRVSGGPTAEGSSTLSAMSSTVGTGTSSSLATTAVLTDYAEGNASAWGTFAADGRATSVSNDSTKVKAGAQSIKFVTASGFDTGLRFPSSGNAAWDLTGKQNFSFWVYAENTTPFQFQGNQPVIVLKSNGGSWTYTPNRIAFSNFNWTQIVVPLAGSPEWVRTTSGSPAMSNVSQLEIHGDTWDYGFNLYVDAVTFDYTVPVPNPVPATTTIAEPIKPKVLLYCFNPIMENKGGVRQNVAYGWQDPVSLTNQNVADLKQVSRGVADYQIVETVVADKHPYFVDGFQHTDQSFDTAWAARDFHNSTFDYARFVAENNIGPRIDSGELDEVWIYTGPISGTYESAMAGNGNYWINGIAPGINTQRAFVIMGWNFERGVGEAIHSYGHRAESILTHSYGAMASNQDNNWNKFTVQDRNLPGLAGLGNVHFPHNGMSDYDYANTRLATSNADDWGTYPRFAGLTRSFNCNEWTPNRTDPQREYLKHWYSHIPAFAGIGYDGFLNNWWRYILDVDQFKAGDGNFKYSASVPTVTLTSPQNGATVYGIVTVKADAAVDGAMGKVELYVDGALYATDYEAPYTYAWDASLLDGSHTLYAKAYESVLGNTAVSSTVTVNVSNPHVSISDVTVLEGDPNAPAAVFNVTLAKPHAVPFKVNYQCDNGTATAGNDYTAVTGTLTFAAGEVLKTITVPIVADSTVESSETFYVHLSNAVLGIIQDNQGVGTILNNAAPVAVSLAPADTVSRVDEVVVLTAKYSDANGAGNLSQALLKTSPPTGANASLQVLYDCPANRLYLRNDIDTAWVGGFVPGSANTISNSSGSLNCASTTVARNGNTLTVAWSLTASSPLVGSNSVNLKCVDFGNLTSGLVALGNWTVRNLNSAPVALADAFNVSEDSALQIAAPGVLANDTDIDADTLTAKVKTQPAHGSLTLNTDGSLAYTPNSSYTGTDTFTYTANDATVDSAPATVTITVGAVNDSPTASPDTAAATEDKTLQVAAPGVLGNDTDIDGDTLNAKAKSQPAHGTLTLNADGSFDYVPEANYNGNDSFTYVANDGTVDSAPATVTISVAAVNDAPAASPNSFDATEDTTLTIAAPGVLTNDADADGDALAVALKMAAAHGTVALNADGSFVYKPAANYSGIDTFTYVANDGAVDSQPATVTITIAPVNDAPVAVANTGNVVEDQTLSIAAPGVLLNDTDPDGDALTAAVEVEPEHGTLTLAADGSFVYTPDADYNGTDSFTYIANDGALDSQPATVTITIGAASDAPLAVADAASAIEDTVLRVAAPGVLANDADADGDTFTAKLQTAPTHGTVALSPDGSFVYTPAANYNGTDSFTYVAFDGALNSVPATVAITIAAVADAPAAVADRATGTEDQPLNVTAPGVLGNDFDVDGDAVTAKIKTLPVHGTLTLGADGSFVYIPAANYNGTDTFSYVANDGALDSAVATVTITIAAVNDAPVATADTANATEDLPLTVVAPGVLGNDYDMDGDAITAKVTTPPAHGTLTLNDNGSFVYTPNANYFGTDSFVYVANDGMADSQPATVTITVAPVADAPTAAADSASGTEDQPFNVVAPGVLGNDYDVDGNAITAKVKTQPAHGTLTLNANGSFIYTPVANYAGGDTFQYVANDGALDSQPATVTLTIAPVNDAPTASPLALSTAYNTAKAFTATASDVDGDTLSFSVGTAPANGTISGASPNFTYTPRTGFSGTDTFGIVARDPAGATATIVVTVTVSPAPNRAPVASGQILTVLEDKPLAFTLTASDPDGDALTYVTVTSPQLGVVSGAGASRTYSPAANDVSVQTLTFKVVDARGAESNTATVEFRITAVNDAPSFTLAATTVAATKNSPLVTRAGFALNLNTGAPNEAQTLTFTVSNSNTALFSQQPAIASNGTLTFTPAKSKSGSATVTVILRDNGGTLNGGVDTSVSKTFTITVK
jgi:VCBS repeat-containing protein